MASGQWSVASRGQEQWADLVSKTKLQWTLGQSRVAHIIGKLGMASVTGGLMKLRSYRDLIAWQKAIELVAEVYRTTQSFPKEETYGLVVQLRRAAVSIPSNIAEGQGRASTGEFRLFLGHAFGSLFEVETQVTIAQMLGYVSQEQATSVLARTTEVGKILNGLLASLKN
jgi:four helix bundle protein